MGDDTKVKVNESTWWDKTAAFSAPRECDMRGKHITVAWTRISLQGQTAA